MFENDVPNMFEKAVSIILHYFMSISEYLKWLKFINLRGDLRLEFFVADRGQEPWKYLFGRASSASFLVGSECSKCVHVENGRSAATTSSSALRLRFDRILH